MRHQPKLDLVASQPVFASVNLGFVVRVVVVQLALICPLCYRSPAPRVTAGHADALDAQALTFLQAQWTEKVTPHTGHATYEEMAAELRLF